MDLLIIAKAQGADDYVSPTIPFIPPTGTVAPTVTNVEIGPTISLESNVLSLKKGEKAKIKIVIFTNDKEIRSFKVTIGFDANLFAIVDANPEVEDIQIPYSNTFFIEKTNEVTVSNDGVGKIRLEAEASGSSPITNKVVSEFEIEALEMGNGVFEMLANESKLTDTDGKNILVNVNNVAINVSNQTITISPTATGSITATPSGGPDQSVSPTPSKIITPKTALADDIGSIGSLLLGSFLVIAGFYLYKKKSNHALQ